MARSSVSRFGCLLALTMGTPVALQQPQIASAASESSSSVGDASEGATDDGSDEGWLFAQAGVGVALLNLDDERPGLALPLALRVGFKPSSKLAIGPGVSLLPGMEIAGEIALTAVGGFVRFGGPGLHLDALIGWGWLYSPGFDGGNGPVVELGVGYDWSVGAHGNLGMLGQVTYAATDWTLTALSLMFTVSYQ